MTSSFKPMEVDRAAAPGSMLRWRIMALLLIVSILPLAIVGIGAGTVFERLLEQKSLELQRGIVRNHANSIESYLFERLRALDLVARSYSFEELSSHDGLQKVFDALSHSYNQAFVDLGIIGEEGSHLAYVGPYDLRDRNYAKAAWFHSVMSEGSYVSDVFMGFRAVPHCVIAVRRQDGIRTWVLRATINSDKFESLVRTDQLGSSGDAYILNTEGVYQTPPKHGKVLVKSESIYPVPHQGVQDQRLVEEGRTVVRVTTWLNNNRWLLVVEQSEDEIQAPAHRALMWGALVLLVAVGLMAITTFLATWHLTSKIDQANRERDHLSEELLRSAKLASLGELSTGLAHEINNPLAIVMTEQTNIGDLAAELPADSQLRCEILDSVARCKKQVERCGGITSKMLQFGRAVETKLEPTDIGPRVEEMVGLMRKQALVRNVDIRLEIEPGLPKLVLDPVELQQVLLNLINNSLYAIQGAGEIHIAVRREGKHVSLSIHDTGSGIPPENMSKIFLPFFTTKPVSKGTGLGLSVCYGMVTKWGGTIEAESEVGVGTEMIIRLPIPAVRSKQGPDTREPGPLRERSDYR